MELFYGALLSSRSRCAGSPNAVPAIDDRLSRKPKNIMRTKQCHTVFHDVAKHSEACFLDGVTQITTLRAVPHWEQASISALAFKLVYPSYGASQKFVTMPFLYSNPWLKSDPKS